MFLLKSNERKRRGGTTLDKANLVVRLFSDDGALQKQILPQHLRQRDPKTGQLIDNNSSDNDTKEVANKDGMVSIYRAAQNKQEEASPVPENITKKGRVGFEVTWNDGARYIYTRRAIAMAAGGNVL